MRTELTGITPRQSVDLVTTAKVRICCLLGVKFFIEKKIIQSENLQYLQKSQHNSSNI